MDTDGYVVVRAFYRRSVKKRSGSGRPFPLFFLLWEAGEKPLIYAVWPGKAEKKDAVCW